MKSAQSLLMVMVLLFLNFAQAQQKQKSFSKKPNHTDVIRCFSVEYENYIQKKNPNRLSNEQFEKWLNPIVENYRKNRSEAGGIITIPVVVHVVNNGEALGVAPNITDEQVRSQITVMNNDFRKKIGTPGYNLSPVGADIQIQFALAQVDPKGNPTNGIHRVIFDKSSWSMDEIETILKPETIWDPGQYLNMWSVNFSDSSLLGYAQFPDASGLQGLDPSGGLASTDGVVANYGTFGSREIYPAGLYSNTTYDKGRTMTHEVGHWLGLRHIWGDATCGDDYCADTPTAHDANYGCPTVLSCNNLENEMVQNYMDYTNDSCMNIFTQNQKDRILTIINNAPRRASLKASTKDQPINLFANDAELKVEKDAYGIQASCGASVELYKKVTITNRGTNLLTNAVLSYSINGGATQQYSWSGTLGTHQSDIVKIPINIDAQSTFSVNIVSVNGQTDERASNNASTGTASLPSFANSVPSQDITLKLQLDNYGSEVSWSLKNSNNEVVYSSPVYQDSPNQLPALMTYNWKLTKDECYVFEINDTEGDGICCDYGEGYYTLLSGEQTIASSGNFGSNESTLFSINPILIGQDILLKKNPVNEQLAFIVNQDFGKNCKGYIYNISGVKVNEMPVQNAVENTVEVSSLQTGVYILKVVSDQKSTLVKFIKN